MLYLVCENCGGYYELQDGESPDDFDRCACGGRLEFQETEDSSEHKNKISFLDIFSNKIVLISGIILILAAMIFIIDPFTPTAEKMDKIMPNVVGAYEVPGSIQKIQTDNSFKPVNYHESPYSISVDKYYFKQGSPVRIHVIMYNTGGGINVIGNKFADNRVIDGKEVRFLQFDVNSFMALFHGSDYSVTITAEPASTSSRVYIKDLQNELLNFTENFIIEFKK